MKIEEYSLSVRAKAFKIIKDNRIFITHDLESCIRFLILPKKEELSPTTVRFDKRNFSWSCGCKHWGIYADENCQHICAAKMLMEKKKMPFEGMLVFDQESGKEIIITEGVDISKPMVNP
jgi:hypothetical protein